MAKQLSLKPDFDKTEERFKAWWEGEIIDRPPVTLYVQPEKPAKIPHKAHRSLRDRWLDVEHTVLTAVAYMESGVYLGDAFPRFCPNLGTGLSATLLGCEQIFGEDTAWAVHSVKNADDWKQYLTRPLSFDVPEWRAVDEMTRLAVELGKDRFIVGMSDLHDAFDVLADLRSSQQLCIDLVECPDLVLEVAQRGMEANLAAFKHNYELVAPTEGGSTCWTPFFYPGPAYTSSCDFWGLVSGKMAHDYILPIILKEIEPLERTIFHLDGPIALRHLDTLLAIPNIQAVQWVYGAGNESAARWIDVFRRIQAAGKSAEVYCMNTEDALFILDTLGPKGMWLHIDEKFPEPESARNFIAEVEKRSLKH